MSPRETVRLVEVGARDGLQNIDKNVPTAIKAQLILSLHAAGLRCIEATSAVSPKAVPQLADCQELLGDKRIQALIHNESLRLPVLVPNIKGLETAKRLGVREVAIFLSATEEFSKANIKCTVQEGLRRAKNVVTQAIGHGMVVRGYVSCIFADPLSGRTPLEAVLRVTRELIAMGCYEVSLGDTLGIGSPYDVRRLIRFLVDNGVRVEQLAGHFHDTYGQALANVWEGYNCGLRVFDSSIAGLGGCPFAPGAKGNAATEDLVYMFRRAGLETGVDLDKLIHAAVWISERLSVPLGSRIGAAMTSSSKRPARKPSGASTANVLEWKTVKKTAGLRIDRSGANIKLLLNSSRNGNALSVRMIDDLVNAFNAASIDASISRVAIVGSGKYFCTGMDLSPDTSRVGSEVASTNDQFSLLTGLFDAIGSCPKVTISCLNGPAYGGGVGLALACDLRVFTRNASLTLSEVKLGLCPATISKHVIRELGIATSRAAMLTAAPLTASELKARGVVSYMVDTAEELQPFLDDVLIRLRVSSSDASRMCKELIRFATFDGGQEQDDTIKELFRQMMAPESPGTFAVSEFRAGRIVDWDEYLQTRIPSKL